MQIDDSDKQFSNAFFPISVSLEPDSNVNSINDLQPMKHSASRNSTLAAMQIAVRDVQSANARF
jgi:hypothetical protein